MRYIIYGAGAVGSVVGACLLEQGLDLLLIARGAHLAAIRKSGLTLQSPRGSTSLRVDAVGHPAEVTYRGADECVILATKTQDCVAALGELRAAAGSRIPVLCLQNGVESPRMASRRFPHVYAAMVMLPCTYLEPGIVQAFGDPVPGIIDVGTYPHGADALITAIANDLKRAGFETCVRADIVRWQYGKLLDNLRNVLQALCGADADCSDVLGEMRAEAETCYRAANIDWVPEAELRQRARGMLSLGQIAGKARGGGSSWQSLARATGTIETDYLNGEISLLGRMVGVRTPVNDLCQDLGERFARARRAPGSLQVDTLRRLRDAATTEAVVRG